MLHSNSYYVNRSMLQYIDCTTKQKGEWLSVPNGWTVAGQVQCPDVQQFCRVYPPTCDATYSCYGRGVCMNNYTCHCMWQFKGNSCQINMGRVTMLKGIHSLGSIKTLKYNYANINTFSFIINFAFIIALIIN